MATGCFVYLKLHHNTEMVFDPSEPEIDEALFKREEWKDTLYAYVKCSEEKPANMPTPYGLRFKI